MAALLGRAGGTFRPWMAIAAGLALSGGRFRRRAALRGVLGAAIASALVKGAALVVGGPRRPAGGSRAASGFAFATGAGQELPALAGPLVALAALSGCSELYAGRRRPSGVVLGAAVGACVGLSTRRLWPVAPRQPAHVRIAHAPTHVEPSPSGRGLVVVVNPSAGSSDRAAEELRAALPEAEVVEVDDGEDFEETLADAVTRGCALGVAGGDGSVNAAAALAAERGKPLFVAPGGTLNHFALALGLESIPDAARAVHEGRAVAVDRGVVDGHTFVNTASIGSYVDLVDAREQLEDTIGKWPAVVVALVRVLRRATPVDLEIDGERRTVWMVFVGNCRYHPAGFAPTWRERLDDGQLDVRIVDGSRPWSRVRLLASVLTGRLGRSRAYEQRWVRTLRLRSLEGPLRLARDGETFEGPEELTIGKSDEPLLVYVPGP